MIVGPLTHSSEVKWIIDIGESEHMVNYINMLTNTTKILSESSNGKFYLPIGDCASVSHVGNSQVCKGFRSEKYCIFQNFKYNLLSVSKMTKELNCCSIFYLNFCLSTSSVGK